jgi:TetR/AcrR family transcriptional regulator, cholesterol catabolism regulator
VKDKIIEGAEKMFFQFGVRSVSMDDVARELAMSKKTLYQYFTNKEELITEVARTHMKAEKEQFQSIAQNTTNAIEELFNISKCLRHQMQEINPALVYDLQKYHPEAWQHFLAFKNEFIRGAVVNNIKRGKAEGFFRQEIDENILATVRVETIQMSFDQHLFPKSEFDLATVQMQVFDHFVHGLLTPLGTAKYQSYQSNVLHSTSFDIENN